MPTSYRCNLHPHGKTKEGKPIDTKLHYQYICREGKYQNIRNHGEDLRHKSSGNIPSWAKNIPGNFWEEAEKNRIKQNYHDRQEARAYREFELTLQMDLSLTDNIECVEKFLERTGIKNNHVYSYAIHEKPARHDEGMMNIHAHIMFDEHIIEKDRPLPTPEDFYKRYSKNKEGQPVGGYKKDRRFHDRPFLVDARKIWADIVNEKLKENGIEERVSHKTLKEQRHDLMNKGDYQNADLLDREPAPKMDTIYRNPELIKEIDAKIKQYELGIPDKKPLKEMNFIERNISLYAKDLILRRAARQIQWNQKKRTEQYNRDRAQEEIKNILESPAVVTVKDIQEYLQEKIKTTQEQIKKNNNEYRKIRSTIAKKEWYHSMVLQKMTNNEYQKRRKAYTEAENKYKEEAAKDESMLDPSIINFQEKYIRYTMNLRKLKTDAEQKKASFESLKQDCMERKEEYEKTLEEIKNENEQKEREAKKILAKTNALKKEVLVSEEILKDFKNIRPDTIIFSEPIPKQLTRDNRVNGTIPVKKLPANSFKGRIYYIIEGDKESVKGIRIGDDIIEGQVPVYQIERKKDDDNRYHITKVRPTEQKQLLYKNKNTITSDGLKKYEAAPSPAIAKAAAQQEQRQKSALSNTIDKMIKHKDPILRLRWNEKENKETNEMEEAEKKLYEGWHPAFPPRTR